MQKIVKVALVQRGLTLALVARETGIATSTLCRLLDPEDGYRGYAYRARVAEILDLSGAEIWGPGWRQAKRPGRKPAAPYGSLGRLLPIEPTPARGRMEAKSQDR